mmetsp:Transcript_851/g.1919  ORF Transcript_851/g.1919 Transcript_851/m.1919 type:complete len:273 (+) Transcript_851:184-1002(+)
MVTASKVLAATAGERGSRDNSSTTTQESYEEDYDDENSDILPPRPSEFLPFGEQLVLETYMRCQRRPHNKKRQEELAQPKRPGVVERAGVEVVNKSAPPDQIASIVERLAQPRKPKVQEVAPATARVAEGTRPEHRKFNLDAMVNRLSTPRVPHMPSAAEQVALRTISTAAGATRPLDLERLAEMARPRHRGASARSWGVDPDWVRDVSSTLDTPRSERTASTSSGLRSAGGHIAFLPAATTTSSAPAPSTSEPASALPQTLPPLAARPARS